MNREFKSFKSMKFQVWNDDDDQLTKWTQVIGSLQFQVSSAHSDTNVQRFVDSFLSNWPDIVLLDVCNEKAGDKQLGLELAKQIRSIDKLVPIIIASRQPKHVYSHYTELEDCCLTSVYHASVITSPALFGPAIRQSIDQWHSFVPEFALARSCIRQMSALNSQSEVTMALKRCLERLPYSGSTSSWHTQLCETLQKLLVKSGFPAVSIRYQLITDFFRSGDPFYMASTKSRKHLSHNVQVFLVGLSVLLAKTELREAAVNDIMKNSEVATRSQSDIHKALDQAVLIWGCIATSHDAAYFVERLDAIRKRFAELCLSALKLTGMNIADMTSIRPTDLAIITANLEDFPVKEAPKNHHADVAARIWEGPCDHLPSKEFMKRVADGIAAHDSKHSPNRTTPISTTAWCQFLALLCDELQDWGRSRETDVPSNDTHKGVPWRQFAVDKLELICSPSGDFVLNLFYVIQDHPKIVKDISGTDGFNAVGQRFKDIIGTLTRNLQTVHPWKIGIAADFVSRDVEAASEAEYLPIMAR